jgi:hypothetical protein
MTISTHSCPSRPQRLLAPDRISIVETCSGDTTAGSGIRSLAVPVKRMTGDPEVSMRLTQMAAHSRIAEED